MKKIRCSTAATHLKMFNQCRLGRGNETQHPSEFVGSRYRSTQPTYSTILVVSRHYFARVIGDRSCLEDLYI